MFFSTAPSTSEGIPKASLTGGLGTSLDGLVELGNIFRFDVRVIPKAVGHLYSQTSVCVKDVRPASAATRSSATLAI